ncbi:MAG: HAD-IA family hydrolase [Gemmatimonadales bacterium]|nr:HAD-IA family hydrolase [Gemmatimonadales bacterium]
MGKKKYKGRRAEAFIFDLDGTLVDSGLDIALAANFTRGRFDLPELPGDTIRGYVGDGVVRLLTRTLWHDVRTGMTGRAGLPVSDEMLEQGLTVFREYYGRHLLDNTITYPGVLDMLARFRRFPLHLATNKPRKFTDAILAGLHLEGAFRRIVAGDEAPVRKPDPSHLQACLDGLDVKPEAVVVVGDSPNDINAAKAMGAVSVGCTYGLVAPGLVRSAKPDLVIDSLAELIGLFPSRTE